ncbi:hypothetical protein SDC9_98518 [bioreactor metagenome]|uniref:ABC3 transporter permease C-terminal domain-containing protein n=1 Tax=bioreactor metagenome TaxID=1076179 RepID=A0A645AFI0_9ZZZZ
MEKAISYTSDNATIETDDYGRERSTAMSGNTSGTYIFADADSFNAFKADVRQMGLSEDYTVSSTDINSYENSLVPVINTANYANTLLLIVLIIGAIILVVLNIFNIRERKYEVGVLTAIGMKKGKVALQFVSELLIVTFVAIILGAAVGAVASVPTSNALLESQISAQEALQQEQSNNFGRQGGNFRGGSFGDGSMSNRNTQINYISTLNASTDMQVVFQLMFIGIALTILASLSAVIFIMRYEPLKILSERA